MHRGKNTDGRGSQMQTFVKPPLRDRDVAVLCLAFGLRHTEGRMLAWLLANDCSSAEQLRAAAALNKKLAYSSMRVFLCALRAKLKLHDIKINTLVKLGYGIDAESRAKIRRGVEKYGAEGGLPARVEPDLTPDAATPPD
jgi:hypothetical protein